MDSIRKAHLIDLIRENNPHESPEVIEQSVKTIVRCLRESLISGNRIEIRGFGAWSVCEREARQAHNPKTGEKVQTERKRVVRFRAGKALKNAVKERK